MKIIIVIGDKAFYNYTPRMKKVDPQFALHCPHFC